MAKQTLYLYCKYCRMQGCQRNKLGMICGMSCKHHCPHNIQNCRCKLTRHYSSLYLTDYHMLSIASMKCKLNKSHYIICTQNLSHHRNSQIYKHIAEKSLNCERMLLHKLHKLCYSDRINKYSCI